MQRLHADAYHSYDCTACGRPGTTTEPTTVAAERGPAAVRVTLNHAACAPSRVRSVHADRVPAGIARMRCLPAVLDFDQPPRLRALLLFEPAVELSAHAGRRPPRPRRIAPSRRRLHPPRSRRPDARAGSRLAPAARARPRHPPGPRQHRGLPGTCRLPLGWRAVAAQAGGPVLIIGVIGLPAAPDARLTPERLHALINAAAGTGSLLAAQITHGADVARRQS
jgi:hypothetical protein